MTSRLKARSKPAKASVEKVVRPATKKPKEPWRAAVGQWVTFYYEGGHGDRYWSGGWHVGVIREIPIKGTHKNWMRLELPSDHYAVDVNPRNQHRTRRLLPHEKVWAFGANVNELGDFVYHGPKLHEVVAERQEAKAEDVAKAAKRQPRRFKT